MAAKPRFRIRMLVFGVIATGTASLAFASASLADTGSVYFDSNDNTAAGDTARLFNGTLTGGGNVGLGRSVMRSLTTGNDNVAVGDSALTSITSGNENIATGTDALFNNTTGGGNIATGDSALNANASGANNIAIGAMALEGNLIGDENLAIGEQALQFNGGHDNTGLGHRALFSNTGDRNIALGSGAGQNLDSGSNNIDIGNQGQNAGESKTIRIGTKGDQTRAFIAGISGKTVSGTGTPVVVNAQGQLGTASAAKPAASKTATDRRFSQMEATMERQQRQIRRQGKEIRALRAQN